MLSLSLSVVVVVVVVVLPDVSRSFSTFPLERSKTFAVPSSEAVQRRDPSALKFTARTSEGQLRGKAYTKN